MTPPAKGPLEFLADCIERGSPVVPLLGSGVSIEAGIPALRDVTRYLAQTKAYIRKDLHAKDLGVLKPVSVGEPPDQRISPPRDASIVNAVQPHQFLSEVGWLRPETISTRLWYSLAEDHPVFGPEPSMMDQLIKTQLLDSIGNFDRRLATYLQRRFKGHTGQLPISEGYWRVLVQELARSEPDLIDSLFHTLTRAKKPGTSHRILALLAPILRMNLFLTINFDSLLEDAFRQEGLQPTVFEIPEGVGLPSPKLSAGRLSLIKLHGGAHRLLAGDKLDAPLDADFCYRYKEFFPSQGVLLVMGVGGWDQRVLDLVGLTRDVNGTVLWLHHDQTAPKPLTARFPEACESSSCLRTGRVSSPGGFLRSVYSAITGTIPFTRRKISAFQLPPVVLSSVTGVEEPTNSDFHGRMVVFEETEKHYGLGSSALLAKLVSSVSATHKPVWVDMETKSTWSEVVSEVMGQLRKYDSSLSQQKISIEKILDSDGKKAIRRLFGALAGGRYIIAFNSVDSFGRDPMGPHHLDDLTESEAESRANRLIDFLSELVRAAGPRKISEEANELGSSVDVYWEHLGLLDSILGFSVGWDEDPQRRRFQEEIVSSLSSIAKENPGKKLLARVEVPRAAVSSSEPAGQAFDGYSAELILISAYRRRRHGAGLLQLLGKYSEVQRVVAASGRVHCQVSPEQGLDPLLQLKHWGLARLESGEFWMGRKTRNSIYQAAVEASVGRGQLETRLLYLLTLKYVHRDLAVYYAREVYAGTKDVDALLESIYHRWRSVEVCGRVLETVGPSKVDAPWLRGCAGLIARNLMWRRSDLVLRRSGQGENDGGQAIGRNWLEDSEQAESLVLEEELLYDLLYRWISILAEVVGQEREVLLSKVSHEKLLAWTDRFIDKLGFKSIHLEGYQFESQQRASALREALADLSIELGRLRAEVELDLACGHIVVSSAAETATERRVELADSAVLQLVDQLSDGDGRTVEAEAACCLEAYSYLLRWRSRLDVEDQELIRRSASLAPRIKVLLANCRSLGVSRSVDISSLSAPRSDQTERVNVGALPQQIVLWKVRVLHWEAQKLIWHLDPWPARYYSVSKGDLENLRGALKLCSLGLELLDGMREEDSRARAALHSARARALYLLAYMDFESDEIGLFNTAFREFDLAYSGFSGGGIESSEGLAIALLRKSEGLILQADSELFGIRSAKEAMPDKGVSESTAAPSVPWRSSGETEVFTQRMSFRLDAAAALLDSAEGIMIDGRRRRYWWACLFQLRAQVALERALFRVSFGSTEQAGRRATEILGATRDGLLAVRQSLDLLMPSKERRHKVFQNPTVLLDRVLRTYTSFLVLCWLNSRDGLSRESDDQAQEEANSRFWASWLYLNQLVGLVHLPQVAAIREWLVQNEDASSQPADPSRRRQYLESLISNALSPEHGNFVSLFKARLLAGSSLQAPAASL